MASKTSKIEMYINEQKNKSKFEMANDKLLKLFGDEETYNRFILTNINSKITRAFCALRSDGLYMSCAFALRNFDGSYKDFARFHNQERFNYPVVLTAFNDLFRFELGLFACGSIPSNKYIKKIGYYNMFNNNSRETIYTPQVLSINGNHKNFEIINKIGINRDKNLPYIYMDSKTLSAFTHFRIMAYNKFKDYMEYGIADKVKELNLGKFYNPNDNAYVAYAIALKETCDYFKTFYPPEEVVFTNANLPYKGLSVIEQKVENIKKEFGINTIGTIRHFNSAKALPMTDESLYHITNVLVKMIEFKGKFVQDKNEYNMAYEKYKDILMCPAGMSFDANGAHKAVKNQQTTTVLNENKVDEEKQKCKEIEKVLQETSLKINLSNSLKDVQKFSDFSKQINPVISKLNKSSIDVFKTSQKLSKTNIEIQKIKESKIPQLPMFLEINVGGQFEYIPNAITYVNSTKYNKFAEIANKTLNTYYDLLTQGKTFLVKFDNLNKSALLVKEKEEQLKNSYEEKKSIHYEHECYTFINPETNTRVVGSFEEYELANSKREYIENYLSVKECLEKVVQLQVEFKTGIDESTKLIDEMIKTEGFSKQDFEYVTNTFNEIDIELASDIDNPTL